MLLATGRAEIMLDAGLALWDVAPMLVIVPEAGGSITDYDGTPFPQAGDVVSTNGHVHDEVVRLLVR